MCKTLFFLDFWGLRKNFFEGLKRGGVSDVCLAESRPRELCWKWAPVRRAGVCGAVESGGEAVLRTTRVFLACRSPPLTPATTRPPELHLECCGTGLGGVRVEPSGQGEALLRTKMAILGQVVLSRAPQGIMTRLRTPELYLEWDSDGR